MILYYQWILTKEYQIICHRYVASSEKERKEEAFQREKLCSFSYTRKIPWKKLRKKELLAFTKEFIFLSENALTYSEILALMAAYEKNIVLKKIQVRILENIKKGNSLYEGFADVKDFVGDAYLNMIRIGESSGNLEKSLKLLLEEMEEGQSWKKQILSLLLYPMILLLFASVLILSLLYFVLPSFLDLFRDSEIALPWMTKVLLLLRDGLPYALLIFGLFIFSISHIFKHQKHTKLQQKLELYIYQHYYQKGLYSKILAHRILKQMTLLMEAGYSFQELLLILEKDIRNIYFRKNFQRLHRAVYQGKKLSEALSYLGVFSERELYFFRLGEESGNLHQVLVLVAAKLKEEFQYKMKKYIILVEPLIFLIIGSFLGFAVLGIYIPIFSLSSNM